MAARGIETLLCYIGWPQSKEGDERTEAKLDEILRKLDPGNAKQLVTTLDNKYPRK